jgi:hypothetical protein
MRLVSSVLLAGLVGLGGCTNGVGLLGQGCYSKHELSIDVPPSSSAPLEFKVKTCQVDRDACPELCDVVLSTAQPNGASSVLACQVVFDGDTAHVQVAYQLADGPDCPVPDLPAPGVPVGGGG